MGACSGHRLGYHPARGMLAQALCQPTDTASQVQQVASGSSFLKGRTRGLPASRQMI